LVITLEVLGNKSYKNGKKIPSDTNEKGRVRNEEPGVRIQNSGEKQSKLSFSQLLATGYWLLTTGFFDFGLINA
jgi:hypothetical protein